MVLAWMSGQCKSHGVRAKRVGEDVELRKGDRALLVTSKHVFFAAEVARSFDAFAHALPAVEKNGVLTTDYASAGEGSTTYGGLSAPDTFNAVKRTLRSGVRIEVREGGVWLLKAKQGIILSPDHLVYAPEVAESFERFFQPLVPELRDGLEVLDYSRPGTLQTFRASGLQFEMASFPEEEEELEESFRWYRPKAGDLVFDIGAHCGVSTYHLSEMVGPEGKVVAFEPDPVTFAILQRNVERYGLTNVVLQNAAVAGTAGKLAFSSEGTVGSMLMSVLRRPSAGSVVEVDAMTLTEVFERWGTPNLCKIDIEGAEIDVIEKSAELLRTHPTNFSLDTCHLKADGKPTSTDIERLFRSYGYEALSEAKPLMATWARPR